MCSTKFLEESIIPQNCFTVIPSIKSIDNAHGMEEVDFFFLSSKKNMEFVLEIYLKWQDIWVGMQKVPSSSPHRDKKEPQKHLQKYRS